MSGAKNILVIRLGALGDVLQCLKPFQDIRRANPQACITFLTTPPFLKLARAMPWFDQVLDCGRPSWLDVPQLLQLAKEMRKGDFGFVFDLQQRPRTDFYYRLFFSRKKTPWFGTAKGCSHPRRDFTKTIHVQQGLLQGLRRAGVPNSGAVDLGWLKGDIAALELPGKYVVLVPGCTPDLPHKRWPPRRYVELANLLRQDGLDVLAVGTTADKGAIDAITDGAPFVRDLSDKTDIFQLASVLRGAQLVVGNDTGPVFLAAMQDVPTLTLMSQHTNPVFSGPIGERCGWLKENDISAISAQSAWQKVSALASLAVQPRVETKTHAQADPDQYSN